MQTNTISIKKEDLKIQECIDLLAFSKDEVEKEQAYNSLYDYLSI